MFETPTAKSTLRLSLAVFVVAVLGAVWEVLADQAPGSPLYLGMLPSPIQGLRATALGLGVVLFLCAQLVSYAFPGDAPRSLRVWLHVGSCAVIGSALYGASTGLHGEQFKDLRPDALPLFLIKHAGYALLIVAFARIGIAAAKRR